MAEPSTIARPYAEAAFKLADAAGRLREWSEMLAALAVVAQDERVLRAIRDPGLSDAKVAGLFISILAGKLTADAENFVRVLAENKRLDIVVHNAGHMVFGPAEAFTPEQLAELYDVNVLSTQRVNRAALPQLRKQKRGLVVWVSSSSAAGGTPPYLAPYFAAKAGMDALAVVYARELTRWGIETSIIVPGAFTGGTNHFAHAGSPADQARAAEYEAGPYAGFANDVLKGFSSIVPADADVSAVADAIVKVVDAPVGRRPFRVHIDPSQDGAEVVNAVSDRVRVELLRRIGLGDLLSPRDFTAQS